ncbi:MAG: hypothetical protein HOO06_09650 [Bdellovibrionaceae bacterium]|jgi:hypothetical protein|nr:hypothetical protein [Pseudobdellovibrionaceae bacterium]
MNFKNLFLISTLFFLLINTAGCPSGDSSSEPAIEVENVVFASQPEAFAVVGVTYAYSPVPQAKDYSTEYSISSFSGVVDGSINNDQREITWTPTLADLGENELSVQVTSGNKLLTYNWKINVVQAMALPLANSASLAEGINFTDGSFVEGFSLKTTPNTNFDGASLSLSMADVDLTKGKFSKGRESQALILEFKEGVNSLGELNDISNQTMEIEVSIETKSLANPLMPPAPGKDETYFLVMTSLNSMSGPSSSSEDIQIIPISEKNGTLSTIFEYTFAKTSAHYDKQKLFMAQLVRTSSLRLLSSENNFELFWLFEEDDNVEKRKIYASKFLHKTLEYLQESRTHFSDLGCAQPSLPTRMFISPNLKTFASKYKNSEKLSVPYISFSDCRNWGYNRFSCDFPMTDNNIRENESIDESYAGVPIWRETVAHEYFHIQQFANSRIASFYHKDPRSWLAESTATFAAEEVIHDPGLSKKTYLGYDYGFEYIWNNEFIRTGLTSLVDPNLELMFPAHTQSIYQLGLFFQYIKQVRSGDLNICQFIKSPEYQNANEPHYDSLSTFAEQMKYYAPLERLLDSSSSFTDFKALRNAFSRFVFSYSFQVADFLPIMDELRTSTFIFDLTEDLITDELLPLNHWVEDDHIGAHSAIIKSDNDRRVKISVKADFPEFSSTTSETFYAELYPLNMNVFTPTPGAEAIAVFNFNNPSQYVELEANRRYAFVFIQGDFTGQMDNKLINFNYTIANADKLKPFIHQDSKYEGTHNTAHYYTSLTRDRLSYLISSDVEIYFAAANYLQKIDPEYVTGRYSGRQMWSKTFLSELKISPITDTSVMNISSLTNSTQGDSLSTISLHNNFTYDNTVASPDSSYFNLDLEAFAHPSATVLTGPINNTSIQDYISEGEAFLPTADGLSNSVQPVVYFPQVSYGEVCIAAGPEDLIICHNSWVLDLKSISYFDSMISEALSLATSSRDTSQWEVVRNTPPRVYRYTSFSLPHNGLSYIRSVYAIVLP